MARWFLPLAVTLPACDVVLGYRIDVTVGADTLAALPDPTRFAVVVTHGEPDSPLPPELQPLDGSVDRLLRFTDDVYGIGPPVGCPRPFTAELVALPTDPDELSVPVDPPVDARVGGDCPPNDRTRFFGSASL